jgi:hypothetical protein
MIRHYTVTKMTESARKSFKTIHVGLQMDQPMISDFFDNCEMISFRFYCGVRTIVVGDSLSFICFTELENY